MAINKDGYEGGSFLTYEQQVKMRTKNGKKQSDPIDKKVPKKKAVADV